MTRQASRTEDFLDIGSPQSSHGTSSKRSTLSRRHKPEHSFSACSNLKFNPSFRCSSLKSNHTEESSAEALVLAELDGLRSQVAYLETEVEAGQATIHIQQDLLDAWEAGNAGKAAHLSSRRDDLMVERLQAQVDHLAEDNRLMHMKLLAKTSPNVVSSWSQRFMEKVVHANNSSWLDNEAPENVLPPPAASHVGELLEFMTQTVNGHGRARSFLLRMLPEFRRHALGRDLMLHLGGHHTAAVVVRLMELFQSDAQVTQHLLAVVDALVGEARDASAEALDACGGLVAVTRGMAQHCPSAHPRLWHWGLECLLGLAHSSQTMQRRMLGLDMEPGEKRAPGEGAVHLLLRALEPDVGEELQAQARGVVAALSSTCAENQKLLASRGLTTASLHGPEPGGSRAVPSWLAERRAAHQDKISSVRPENASAGAARTFLGSSRVNPQVLPALSATDVQVSDMSLEMRLGSRPSCAAGAAASTSAPSSQDGDRPRRWRLGWQRLRAHVMCCRPREQEPATSPADALADPQMVERIRRVTGHHSRLERQLAHDTLVEINGGKANEDLLGFKRQHRSFRACKMSGIHAQYAQQMRMQSMNHDSVV
mmetsp:Transcript_7763/g.14644  ORF Transcript_7763/g.14644 Transcript_7763/m.14644 type:complete len:597 (-) Transcript_7763:633-2423(-)|eukprot:CAMPEP_0114319372 /NCGR_PEP_ID=MMETSP0059-20121206/25201_1 /TAXON_ID=36894 /ORGANISM="Pyramimonas parkeae, Strain CCMP726" /LENGTH=596 /DNA_ID=CAMNT_0001446365 /DNA_START=491 /DNA_END=2281 /DNA_ORIENTATION=-